MPYESVPRWLREIPGHLKTSEMCNEAVAQFPYALGYVPDELKTQEMCDEAVDNNPLVLYLVPDRFETEDMCIKALGVDPWSLRDILDNLKTQETCNKAVEDDPSSLLFVPDWFVKQQHIKAWGDDDYWYDVGEMIEWYEGYKKRKSQKAKIKEELLPIAWHPSRVMDWRMSEGEKGWWE